jgi:uncharacterized protein
MLLSGSMSETTETIASMNLIPASQATDLCSACGLCCNGILFYSVRLQPKDSPKELIGLGLKLQRKKKQYSILQPCPAFCGTHCSIYEKRPERCRAFECEQLRQLTAGETTEALALEKIREARESADHVMELMWNMGERNEKRNILRRYESICARVPDASEEPLATHLKNQLTAAMQKMEEILQQHFRVSAEA